MLLIHDATDLDYTSLTSLRTTWGKSARERAAATFATMFWR